MLLDLERKQTTFMVEEINGRSADPLSRERRKRDILAVRTSEIFALFVITLTNIKRDVVMSRYLMNTF